MMITVFTATYNRGWIIENLYNSLCRQTCKNFEWLVLDDGSTDNTEELFKNWMVQDNGFDIRYKKKANGGLNRALNDGLQMARGRYFFKADSDDYLTDDCIEKFLEWIPGIDNDDRFSGIGAVQIKKDGRPIKGIWPKVGDCGFVDCTNIQRKEYDLDADMCEIYKVDVLSKYGFPVWPGEKFCPEAVTLDKMAYDGYCVRWYSIGVKVIEYYDDGLTKGNWNLLRRNPMGYAMLSNIHLLTEKNLKKCFGNAASLIALSIVGGHPQYIFRAHKKGITVLALPYGIALSIRRKLQFKWDDPINRRNF